ncbi:MAG: hypothetical protein HUJ72_06135 [Blautia sp.]|nr:hypothetical protein [Blautia sp.]
MNLPLKESLDKMCEVCDLVAERSGLKDQLEFGDDSVCSVAFKLNAFSFLAYLAAADGVLSWNECAFMGELFDLNITPDKLRDFIAEKEIYSTEFEETTPMMLQFLVAVDNAVYNSDLPIEQELGETMVNLYLAMGVGLIESNDRSVDSMVDSERKDFETYIGMMKKYVSANTDKHHTDLILDFTKNGARREKDSEKELNKGAVRAPKKKM